MTEIHGTPISSADQQELLDLRAALSPETASKTLDGFAVWLFSGAGALGALATAGKVFGLGDLDEAGRRRLAWAALAFGICLTLAALSKMPQPAQFNPNDPHSMRRTLERVVMIREVLLIGAAFAFAAALLLAAFAPLEETGRVKTERPGFTFAVDSKGAATATFVVAKAKPYSPVEVRSLSRPKLPTTALPQANGITDGDGRASVKITFAALPRAQRLIVSGRWRDGSGMRERSVLRVALRARSATQKTKSRGR